MAKYIDVVLTNGGKLLAAPCCSNIRSGDFVGADGDVFEVKSVAQFCTGDGLDDALRLVAALAGSDLPLLKIAEIYARYDARWDEEETANA